MSFLGKKDYGGWGAWVPAVEWGMMYSLSTIFGEYYLLSSLSETGVDLFGCLVVFGPAVAMFFAVKEIRDKRRGRQIGFWPGFGYGMLAGGVIAFMGAVWGLLMYDPPPALGGIDAAVDTVFLQMVAFAVFCSIIALILRRGAS